MIVKCIELSSYVSYDVQPNVGHYIIDRLQGLVAGLWSSLSGAGRFVSRGGTGFLVDTVGRTTGSLLTLLPYVPSNPVAVNIQSYLVPSLVSMQWPRSPVVSKYSLAWSPSFTW